MRFRSSLTLLVGKRTERSASERTERRLETSVREAVVDPAGAAVCICEGADGASADGAVAGVASDDGAAAGTGGGARSGPRAGSALRSMFWRIASTSREGRARDSAGTAAEAAAVSGADIPEDASGQGSRPFVSQTLVVVLISLLGISIAVNLALLLIRG